MEPNATSPAVRPECSACAPVRTLTPYSRCRSFRWRWKVWRCQGPAGGARHPPGRAGARLASQPYHWSHPGTVRRNLTAKRPGAGRRGCCYACERAEPRVAGRSIFPVRTYHQHRVQPVHWRPGGRRQTSGCVTPICCSVAQRGRLDRCGRPTGATGLTLKNIMPLDFQVAPLPATRLDRELGLGACRVFSRFPPYRRASHSEPLSSAIFTGRADAAPAASRLGPYRLSRIRRSV